MLRTILWFALVLGAVPLSGEVILLKSGQTVTGQIAGQTAAGIWVVTERARLQIPKQQLLKIQYVPFTPAQKRAMTERPFRTCA